MGAGNDGWLQRLFLTEMVASAIERGHLLSSLATATGKGKRKTQTAFGDGAVMGHVLIQIFSCNEGHTLCEAKSVALPFLKASCLFGLYRGHPTFLSFIKGNLPFISILPLCPTSSKRQVFLASCHVFAATMNLFRKGQASSVFLLNPESPISCCCSVARSPNANNVAVI